MKNPSVIAKERIHAARDWIFRWRGLDGTPLRGLLALLITGSAFAVFAATVRIRVSAPQQWVERKASIIHLSSEGDGKIWALRAQEGGPFPSRFDPSQWEKMNGFSDLIASATRSYPVPYQPVLRDLPKDDEVPPLSTLIKGERVFPQHPVKTTPVAIPVPSALLPTLFPIVGLSRNEIPTDLPPLDPKLAETLASGAWRFLIRLQADGGVSECVTFSEDPGGNTLADWLRGVNFTAAVAKKSEWIGVAVGFTTQAPHGPDTR